MIEPTPTLLDFTFLLTFHVNLAPYTSQIYTTPREARRVILSTGQTYAHFIYFFHLIW